MIISLALLSLQSRFKRTVAQGLEDDETRAGTVIVPFGQVGVLRSDLNGLTVIVPEIQQGSQQPGRAAGSPRGANAIHLPDINTESPEFSDRAVMGGVVPFAEEEDQTQAAATAPEPPQQNIICECQGPACPTPEPSPVDQTD